MLFKVFLLATLVASVSCLENGLARTPPMGWLAWERFTCETDCQHRPDECIGSKLFRAQAERLVNDGYHAAGYEYVNVDDCWSKRSRAAGTNQLQADEERFQGGIADLASYIHALGLKLGLYGDCGLLTCACYPGQLKTLDKLEDNYFALDAASLAEWTVDSFKFDGCFIDPFEAESICPKMAEHLAAAGRRSERPILLVCEWPFYMLRFNRSVEQVDWALAARSCNAWRYYEDIEDSWLSILNVIDFSVRMQDTIVEHHGPGHWFDPDQLVIGNFGLSFEQARAQMAIWCLWSAPLYMSNDLRKIEPKMADILKNRNLIQVDQDQLGVFGLRVAQAEGGEVEAFVKPVEIIKNNCPSFVVVYLNRATLGNRKRVSFPLRDLLKGARKAIEVAASRYAQLYADRWPGGPFDAAHCQRRLELAMSRPPSEAPAELVVTPHNQRRQVPLQEQAVVYDVLELFEGQPMARASLDGHLELRVAPSGVAMVKLTEI